MVQGMFMLVAALMCGAVVAAVDLRHTDGKDVIENEFVVMFQSNNTDELVSRHMSMLRRAMDESDSVMFEYNYPGFKGYAAKLTAKTLKFVLSENSVVDYVEANQVMRASQSSCSVQNQATWGLVRSAEKTLKIDGEYHHPTSAGEGADCYIVDSGIYVGNKDFEGRAKWGIDATGEGEFDKNGHGTHVAGTVMSATYGIAKKATAIAVKVLESSGSGSTAGVIKGVEYTCSDHTKKNLNAKAKKGSTANMSLGGGLSTALNNAVSAAIACGISFAVAAGNEDSNACWSSPASTKSAVTVGATTNKDERSYFSNFGTCLDIFAPGSSITSTWIGSPYADNTISGTSMASPHVAGVMTKIVGDNPNFSPAQVTEAIMKAASSGIIEDVGAGSPNEFLYSPCS